MENWKPEERAAIADQFAAAGEAKCPVCGNPVTREVFDLVGIPGKTTVISCRPCQKVSETVTDESASHERAFNRWCKARGYIYSEALL